MNHTICADHNTYRAVCVEFAKVDGVHKGDVVRGVPVETGSRQSKIIQMGGIIPLHTKVSHIWLLLRDGVFKKNLPPVAVHVKGHRVNQSVDRRHHLQDTWVVFLTFCWWIICDTKELYLPSIESLFVLFSILHPLHSAQLDSWWWRGCRWWSRSGRPRWWTLTVVERSGEGFLISLLKFIWNLWRTISHRDHIGSK